MHCATCALLVVACVSIVECVFAAWIDQWPCMRCDATSILCLSILLLKSANMSYCKEAILRGIAELNERSGSTLQAIKKFVQSNLPKGKEHKNGVFLLTIKRAISAGALLRSRGRTRSLQKLRKQHLKNSTLEGSKERRFKKDHHKEEGTC